MKHDKSTKHGQKSLKSSYKKTRSMQPKTSHTFTLRFSVTIQTQREVLTVSDRPLIVLNLHFVHFKEIYSLAVKEGGWSRGLSPGRGD
jgi:hypothetical protein